MTVSLNSPSERHNYRPQRSCCKVMSPVCQSFFSQGVLCPSMHHRSHDWGVSVQGSLCLGCLCQGGGVSRGFSVQGGVSVQGCLCRMFSGQAGSLLGVSVWEGLCQGNQPYSNEQAVPIPLECILVYGRICSENKHAGLEILIRL